MSTTTTPTTLQALACPDWCNLPAELHDFVRAFRDDNPAEGCWDYGHIEDIESVGGVSLTMEAAHTIARGDSPDSLSVSYSGPRLMIMVDTVEGNVELDPDQADELARQLSRAATRLRELNR